ncbi:hypothetical protein [Desulfovibrio sp. SGI.169]|uniref:hypothetical protein n=1 Tax=Desulfovibrio sp. SGI.169 TaxID=3420561 RepID=UPI003D0291C5
MPYITHGTRRWLALTVWAAGLLLFLLLGLWNLNGSRRDAENRLISEAGHLASQLAALLSLPAWELDELTARTIVMAVMEDDRIYAVKVQTRQGMLEGQRRNYQWEPVPWDDEIAENTVQGMNPLKMEGRTIGSVEVYLSPRLSAEEQGMVARREGWRFALAALFCTGALLLLLWHWGDMARLRRLLASKTDAALAGDNDSAPDRIVLGLSAPATDGAEAPAAEARPAASPVNPSLGRNFQCKHANAWGITAGLFRQSFAHAPELLSRLYADGEVAGLCHLGRMLELAAPCLGAVGLEEAARHMQAALNDPQCETAALAVEACARALEDVLAALGGEK